MDKAYSPRDIEQRLYARWEAQGLFRPRGRGQPYSIVIPPPNVTGTLHMGHAFQDTIMDGLTRLHRMLGDNALWQPGMDHAGIATQMVVERQLNVEGRTRHDLGREAFVARVWRWKGESGGTIARQLRRLGASVDWSRDRFTMDEDLSRAVTETFVRLYGEGLIYRGQRLVNWDPVLHTALSDLEVLSQQEDGYLWHLRYPLAAGGGAELEAGRAPAGVEAGLRPGRAGIVGQAGRRGDEADGAAFGRPAIERALRPLQDLDLPDVVQFLVEFVWIGLHDAIDQHGDRGLAVARLRDAADGDE